MSPFIKVRNWFKTASGKIAEVVKKVTNTIPKALKIWNYVGPVLKILLPDVDFSKVDIFVEEIMKEKLDKNPDISPEILVEEVKNEVLQKFSNKNEPIIPTATTMLGSVKSLEPKVKKISSKLMKALN